MLVVTGGGGFIGSVLAAALNEAGRADLVIVDRFGTDDKWRNIAKRDFFEIVADRGAARLGSNGSAARSRRCFISAPISSTTATDADEIIATNLNYSIALWRWCAARGKAADLRLVGGDLWRRRGRVRRCRRPRGAQAAAAAEPLRLVEARLRPVGVARGRARARAPPHWVGLKFFNVFGPNEYHKGDDDEPRRQELPPRSRPARRSGLFKSHRPDYRRRRAAARLRLCQGLRRGDAVAVAPGRVRAGIYNIGTGAGAQLSRPDERARRRLRPARPTSNSSTCPPAIRPNYQYFTEAKMSRLRRAGYNAPFTPLEDAVTDLVTRHLAQSDPYL